MKELFEIEFKVTTKVSASPLAKGLTEPLTKALAEAVPLIKRTAEAYVKQVEASLEE